MTTINGRTPEEIERSLKCRAMWGTPDCKMKCDECGTYVPGLNGSIMAAAALAYIQKLKTERDAAIILLRGECLACLHNEAGEPCRTKEVCQRCVYNEDSSWGMYLDYNWQWRGVQDVE